MRKLRVYGIRNSGDRNNERCLMDQYAIATVFVLSRDDITKF